jgi:exodeoxyribonuclease III
MRIITANLNGIRSAANKGFFEWLQTTNADIICLQEVKAQAADMTPEMHAPAGKLKPDAVIEGLSHFNQNMADIDAEGRYIEAQFGNLSVISLYLPSGSSGEERQAFKFSVLARIMPHLEALAKSGREVVICGDWNIAHQEIDLKNYKSNKKNSGFLPEERAWFSDLFGRVGWVDVYRKLHPNTTDDCYTWWSNRGAAYEKNVGWRLDYQVATPNFAQKASSCSIYKAQKFSDHAPLIIDYLSA